MSIDDSGSISTGNAGSRVACGIIEKRVPFILILDPESSNQDFESNMILDDLQPGKKPYTTLSGSLVTIDQTEDGTILVDGQEVSRAFSIGGIGTGLVVHRQPQSGNPDHINDVVQTSIE